MTRCDRAHFGEARLGEIGEGGMVGVARIELATPTMST